MNKAIFWLQVSVAFLTLSLGAHLLVHYLKGDLF